MAKFITLTKDGSSGKRIYINTQEIQYFFRNEDYTKIVFNSHGDNSRVLVTETPEEILKLINGGDTAASSPQGNLGKAFRGDI